MNRSKYRTRRIDVLLTESEHVELLRLSAQLKQKRSAVMRRALRELRERTTGSVA